METSRRRRCLQAALHGAGRAAACLAGIVPAAVGAAAVVVAAAGILSGIGGCADRPEEPVFDNPFDPDGPSGGDPFGVTALVVGDAVLVTWTQPALPSIAIYRVLRAAVAAGPYVSIAELPPTSTATLSFTDTSYRANAVNWYKVQARDAFGKVSAESRVTPVQVTPPPRLILAGGASATGTRFIDVDVGSEVGDTVELDSTAAFATPTAFDFSGVTRDTLSGWDLGPAPSNSGFRWVYLRVLLAGVEVGSAVDSIAVLFQPSFSLVGNPATVADSLVDLSIDGDGIILFRFALSEAELATATWVAPADTFRGFELAPDPQPQTLFGEFRADFGFADTTSITVTPDDLSTASFVVENDSAFTADPVVDIQSTAVATEMRFAESPDFTGVPWMPFATQTTFTLSPTPGTKVVFGMFRNAWFTVARTDSIVLVGGAPARERAPQSAGALESRP